MIMMLIRSTIRTFYNALKHKTKYICYNNDVLKSTMKEFNMLENIK